MKNKQKIEDFESVIGMIPHDKSVGIYGYANMLVSEKLDKEDFRLKTNDCTYIEMLSLALTVMLLKYSYVEVLIKAKDKHSLGVCKEAAMDSIRVLERLYDENEQG